MKYKQIFLSALFLAVISATALGQEGQRRMDDMPRMDMAKRLNLSEEQQSQIDKLRTEYQKQQVTHRSKLQLAQIELQELVRSDNPDRSAIEKKIQETSQLQAQQRIARVDQMLAIRNVMTPEQRKIAREGFRERFREGFGRRGFRGGMFRRHGFGRQGFRGPGFQGEMRHGDGFRSPMFGLGFDEELLPLDNERELDPDE